MNLKQLIENKYINVNKHPHLPLFLYNYTTKAQYDQVWNEHTIRCRGLILDSNNNIISNPFPKFFNYGELESHQIPKTTPKVFEKLDGSLGIQYIHSNQLGISTRGSFTSPQSKFATKWINDHYHIDDFNPSLTYLYEIIHPKNRIVINYKDRMELSLLSIRNTTTGVELDPTTESKRLSLSTPAQYTYSTEELLIMAENPNNLQSEGFVLLYPNGQRIKIKYSDYIRVHKIVTDITPNRIYNIIKRDELYYVLNLVPDEFYIEIKEIVSKIELQQSEIIKIAQSTITNLPSNLTQKQKAKLISKSEYPSVSFAILNNKNGLRSPKNLSLKLVDLNLI